MKVKELIKILKNVDPELEVYTSRYHQGTDEYDEGWDDERRSFSAEESSVRIWLDCGWTNKKVFLIK